VKFAFVRDHREHFDVGVMCSVLGVTSAGFYAWLGRPPSPRADRTRVLAEQVRIVHHELGGVYGSIKVTKELRRRHHHANRKTIAKLMRAMGIAAFPPRGGPLVHSAETEAVSKAPEGPSAWLPRVLASPCPPNLLLC
jgi:putative transposase